MSLDEKLGRWWKQVSGQDAALSAVHRAVCRKQLPSLSTGEHKCIDCGQVARVWEHRDYNKPLDVVPVCQSCNVKRGPAKPLCGFAILDMIENGRMD